jgi:hypothetical protein
MASDIAIDARLNIYVAGYTYVSTSRKTGVNAWLVRKSEDLGKTWSNLDLAPNYSDTRANGIALDPGGNPVVCGYGKAADGVWQWPVRRFSVDGRAGAWMDMWQPQVGREGWAQDICIDPTGSIFVTGYAENAAAGSIYTWIIRSLPVPVQ